MTQPVTPPSTPADAVMADRYGGTSPARRRAVILVSGLVGVVALAWVAWAAWFQSTPEVQSSLQSFDVVDDHSATAQVVVKPRDVAYVEVSTTAMEKASRLARYADVLRKAGFVVEDDRFHSGSKIIVFQTDPRFAAPAE